MIKLIIFITCLLSSNAQVHQLTNDTLGTALTGINFIHYSRADCDKCQQVSNIMDEINNDIYLGEVDCSVYSCGVQKFPTLILFINSKEIEYEGELNMDSVSTFLKDQISLHWFDIYVTSESDMEQFLQSSDEPKVITNMFLPELQTHVPSLQYGYSDNDLLPPNTLRVYRGTQYVEYKDEELLEFVLANTIDSWNFVGSPSMARAFLYSHRHVLLFDTSNATKNALEKVAEEFSPQYIFVLVTPNNTDITTMFHVDTYPSLILVSSRMKVHRYPLDGTISHDTVKEHIQRHADGQLTPAPVSEPRSEL